MHNFKKTATELQKPIGLAGDHAGFELKNYLAKKLVEAGYQIIDYGNDVLNPEDDYPDYVVPLALAIRHGSIDRGIAVCGSGVGACIVANKIAGIRACLIHETISARQGVEDNDMNLMCLGGRVVLHSLAWKLTVIFLAEEFSGAERHKRRLAKVAALETYQK